MQTINVGGTLTQVRWRSQLVLAVKSPRTDSPDKHNTGGAGRQDRWCRQTGQVVKADRTGDADRQDRRCCISFGILYNEDYYLLDLWHK